MIVTALHFRLCSEPHLSSLINHMLSIMTHIINEETSLPLLEVVLWNLVKQEKVRNCFHGCTFMQLSIMIKTFKSPMMFCTIVQGKMSFLLTHFSLVVAL